MLVKCIGEEKAGSLSTCGESPYQAQTLLPTKALHAHFLSGINSSGKSHSTKIDGTIIAPTTKRLFFPVRLGTLSGHLDHVCRGRDQGCPRGRPPHPPRLPHLRDHHLSSRGQNFAEDFLHDARRCRGHEGEKWGHKVSAIILIIL